MAKQTIDGITADFQQGGWYGGRQYWNGQLGAPGVVINPSESGYMKQVSSEVNQQSDKEQGYTPGTIDAYLAMLRGSGVGSSAPGAGAVGADGAVTPGAGGANMLGSLSLQGVYDAAYKESGITDLQKQYDDLAKEIAAKKQTTADKTNSINENPWGAEATRTGKIRTLEDYANRSISVLQEQQANIATQINQKKADVETKLNLATKQFELNNSYISTLNNLLSMGALTSATSDDIASFARTTGLPTSFISSAIKSSKDKNVETKLIESTDDAGNVTVSLVTIKDGQLTVAGKQSLGAVGKAKSSTATEDKQQIALQLAQDARNGIPLIDYSGTGADIMQIYGPWLDANTIYNIYNANSKYGPAKEQLGELAKYGVKDINKDPYLINPAPVK